MAADYTQDWSLGNSTFTSVNEYDRGANGVDPLYPEMWTADYVTVSGGQLVKTGAVAGWDGVGIVLKFSGRDGQQGSIKVRFTPNSSVMQSTSPGLFYIPLIEIFANNAARNLTFALDPAGSRGQPFNWDLQARNRNTNAQDSSGTGLAAPTFVAGQEYEFKVCWKCGTYNGVTTANDGYVRWYLDGVLIHELTDFPFVVEALNANALTFVGLAADTVNSGGGLFGTMGAVTVSDRECGSSVPLINNSTPCCGSAPSSGPGGAAGDVLGPPTTAPLPEWTSRCAGGGDYPGGTPVVHSEDWRV